MSTSKSKTAAVAVEWMPTGPRVVEVVHPLPASDIAPLVSSRRSESWAVDVPFGWPDRFVALMAGRHDRPLLATDLPVASEWEKWRTRDIAQRRTDAFLTNDPHIATRPLPASFQLLGATAAMWVLIEARLVELGVHIDRSGADGPVCETYPRAVLAAWGNRDAGKADWASLQRLVPGLTAEDRWLPKLALEDVCDAVVCAFAARARTLGLTVAPRDVDELAAARREGWIHVSRCDPAALSEAPSS